MAFDSPLHSACWSGTSASFLNMSSWSCHMHKSMRPTSLGSGVPNGSAAYGVLCLEAGLTESRTKVHWLDFIFDHMQKKRKHLVFYYLLFPKCERAVPGLYRLSCLIRDRHVLWTMDYPLTTDRSSQARIILLHLLYTPHCNEHQSRSYYPFQVLKPRVSLVWKTKVGKPPKRSKRLFKRGVFMWSGSNTICLWYTQANKRGRNGARL
jgi:hypothetical protein